VVSTLFELLRTRGELKRSKPPDTSFFGSGTTTLLGNIDGVLEEIVATLRPAAPHPNPLPNEERGPR